MAKKRLVIREPNSKEMRRIRKDTPSHIPKHRLPKGSIAEKNRGYSQREIDAYVRTKKLSKGLKRNKKK